MGLPPPILSLYWVVFWCPPQYRLHIFCLIRPESCSCPGRPSWSGGGSSSLHCPSPPRVWGQLGPSLQIAKGFWNVDCQFASLHPGLTSDQGGRRGGWSLPNPRPAPSPHTHEGLRLFFSLKYMATESARNLPDSISLFCSAQRRKGRWCHCQEHRPLPSPPLNVHFS